MLFYDVKFFTHFLWVMYESCKYFLLYFELFQKFFNFCTTKYLKWPLNSSDKKACQLFIRASKQHLMRQL